MDFTRFAVTFETNVQITQNKNPVKDNVYICHIIVNFNQNFVPVSQKKIVKVVAFLLTHTVYGNTSPGRGEAGRGAPLKSAKSSLSATKLVRNGVVVRFLKFKGGVPGGGLDSRSPLLGLRRSPFLGSVSPH